MPLKYLIPVLLLLGTTAPLHARLGETQEHCILRYGNPVQYLPKGILFLKDGMKIYITFTAGLADSIFLQKIDSSAPQRAKPISESEIKQFLSENSGGCQWQYSSVLPDGDVIWITKKSELGALYSQATCSLQVYTRENIAR